MYLEVQRLLEGGGYFNVDSERCGAYMSPALIKGNTLFRNMHLPL